MPSFLYMPGLAGQLVVQEDPDIVEETIEEARLAGEGEFVTLNSAGSYTETREAAREQGLIIYEAEQKDSFVPIKIRHQAVFAIRKDHPGEVPEP